MSDPQDDPGVISISSDSDDGDVAPAAGPSNVNGRTVVAARDSAELDSLHALDDASRAQLHVAIATAPEDRVREAFAALVDSVPAITERVFGMLVAVPPLPVAPPNAAPAPDQGAGGRTKPMIPRWRICENCEKEYDAGTIRRATECIYHDGELEISEDDSWADWDENVHGPMDTEENRIQFPDQFTWSCCERDGTQPGCVQDEHQPKEVQPRQKRLRWH
ncbi:uncharacterized protein TRAVEDRAFT_125706 [Trametes versicolor FP-101664 SS1]|uniref:uncharacterized protein n=1 Tax=Trametes versicolor (strain FP-101664) TaxID=717944 RepID=UPI000462327A|nr:uncharacterized protein TRAVEDRAFT_125706 [Trametes versicolor FP-101664 SS1]EIW57356.1 hypothetical protein TRAVEDRAFT_125706 [Trametes versicolor FP-101664 SS1]